MFLRIISGILAINLATAAIAAAEDSKTPVSADTEQAGEKELGRAERRFQDSNIREARKILTKLENNFDSYSSPLKVRIMLMIVRISYAFEESGKAEKWLEKIYAEDSNVSLDPVIFPPEALSYWKQLAPKNPLDSNAGATQSEAPDYARTRARFWVGLFPFGIGHYDANQYDRGLLFGSLDIAALYSSPFLRGLENFSPRFAAQKNKRTLPDLMALAAFSATWGYEVLDLMPTLLARNTNKSNWVRAALSYAPFGVAQQKNGHIGKAIGLGTTQAALFAYAVGAKSNNQRNTALAVLAMVYSYGVYDGWVHHRDLQADMLQVRVPQPKWSILPTAIYSDNKYHPSISLSGHFF